MIRLINIDHFIHSIKTAIACIIGLLLTKILGFQADQWIVITVIVVMCAQIYVGSVLQKSYLRFLGTLTGCLFATIIIIAAGGNLPFSILVIAIGLSSFVFSYMAISQEKLSYAGTLGAVTTALILISPDPTMVTAGSRFIEISLGILIATCVSQFVLPIHARTHLRRMQIITLEQLRDYYTACMINNAAQNETLQNDLEEAIVHSLSKQRQLAKEAIHEWLGIAYDPNFFMRSLACEKKMLRSINFMNTALERLNTEHHPLLSPTTLQTFHHSVVATLNQLSKIIAAKSTEPFTPLSADLLKDALAKNTDTLTQEELIYADGFLFAAEILTKALNELNQYLIPLRNETK